MNMRSMKMLVIVAVVLVVGVIVLDTANDDYRTADANVLLPDLGNRINDIDRVVVRYPEATVTLEQSGEHWVVRERDDYAADTGTLRQVLIALKDAKKLEQKTANPAMHERLGLSTPGEGDAIGLTVGGKGFEYALVIGNVAQQSYRYLRFADEDQTWLIDQNPEIPDDSGGWLAPGIVDIPSSRVQSVSILHADGEQIDFGKGSADDSTFTVANLPEGRELTYPGVVNGIAGALQNLDLDDVRKRPDELPEPAATVRFETFDGLQLSARTYLLDDESWLAFTADATDEAQDTPQEETGERSDDESTNPETGETADDGAEPEDDAPPAQQADDINATVGHWLYKLPDHKMRLLQRRWADLLKAPDEADE